MSCVQIESAEFIHWINVRFCGARRIGEAASRAALEFLFVPNEIRQFVTSETQNRQKVDLLRAVSIYKSLEKSKGGKL